ncbi:MAG TPA: carboxypeptidase-like regulatory domain-containing protein [Chitinophagaceae bacterium]|nr:carboxypeptidase-like regulatory domain-containing protein [Chitinophagaceae bacterium]
MKRIIYIAIACFSLFTISCQKEISFTKSTTSKDPVIAILQGNVVDENDNPAQGANITVGGKTAVTDAKGYFRIRNASLDKSASLVTAEKPGYFKAFRVFSASTAVNHVKIKLLKKTLAGSLNTSGGGVVSLSNGSSITFSANSFSKASGGTYSGLVNIYAAYIDPTSQDIGETIPGSFLADDKDNKRVILASYAMMAVELESAAGEKLQISTGNTAKLNFSIPSGLQASAPNTIALWYVDEKTGLWKEEGIATKNGNAYEGDVKHFTYWNCDYPGPTVNVTAKFVSQGGLPLIHTEVWIRPLTGWGGAHGYTDSLGWINGPVPANINLVLEVLAPYPCNNAIYSQNVGPFSNNTNLGTITVPGNNSQYIMTIQGKLLNCNSNPVTNGFAEIVYNNITRYASVNATGDFSITFVTCGTAQTTCSITGTDSQAQQQGQPAIVAVTVPVTNAGNITACGTSTLEFMNYTLDGGSVNLSSTIPGDNFYESDTLGVNHITLRGYRSQTENLTLEYASNGAAGTFPVSFFSTGIYFSGGGNSTIIQPFNIVITSHPPVGGYFEGSFSGQFKDVLNVTHNLNGTFRIKRR